MAHLNYLILFLSLLHASIAKECTIQAPEIVAWTKKLKLDLSQIHLRSTPPTNCNDSVSINVKFIMKYFTLYSSEETFTVQTWMFLRWEDHRLQWKPEDYGGIEEIEMQSSSIWTPGSRFNNTVDDYDNNHFVFIPCTVKNNGSVVCNIRTYHNVRCTINLRNWPHDAQDCSLDYHIWADFANNTKLKLVVSSKAIAMFGADYGAEWYISEYKQYWDPYTEKDLKMIFTLVRESNGLNAIVVYPSLLLTILTMSTLLLDVRKFVRLFVSCFSMLEHYSFLQELAFNISQKVHEPPTLLLYFRGSMILTIMNILFTLMLARICIMNREPYGWILAMNTFIYNRYGRFYLLSRWHSETQVGIDEDCKKFNDDWIKFANVVNWIFALIIITTYVCLYLSFVPQPVPET